MCIFTGNYDTIFPWSNAPFERRNLAKINYITKTVCQPKSSENAEQNFVKLCSYEGPTV